MRRALLLLPLLAACATPREACISQASGELSVINSLVAETSANITRGYGLVRSQEVIVVHSTCEATNDEGATFSYPCQETETRTRTVPVALDLDNERAKLASLQQRQRSLELATQSAVQQCIAVHPE
ncbi:MAG: hypothetical protein JKX69_11660 [Rhodobacteraceae bacterium]|nr:hypothetical protein [Paracoccaceae bacterium]